MPVHVKLSLGKKSWEYGQPIAPQPSIFDSHFHSHDLFPARHDPFAPAHELFPSSLDPFASASLHGFRHDFFDLGPQAPPEMRAMVHAQREQLQASPLGPHMRDMGILPPFYADTFSFASGFMPPSTHPLDVVAESFAEETRRESLGASSERHEVKADHDSDDTDATKAHITSPTSSEISLANTSKAHSAPPPPPSYTPNSATVIYESRTQNVKIKTKTVFRGFKLPFLSIGYKHKVSVIHN